MIIGVTGHRPPRLGGYNPNNPLRTWIREQIRVRLFKLRPDKGISGMAAGSDQDFVSVCIDLKIPFIAAVPFEGQDSSWPEHAKAAYQAMLAKAEQVVYVCAPGYAAWKYIARDCYLVDNCDMLLAVYDGTPTGGTAQTVKYAAEVKRLVSIIDPGLWSAQV